jgi:hypothetical protein
VLEAFYPGQFGADAMMDVLFGDTAPAGLLPWTMYDEDLIMRRSVRDMDLQAKGGITYLYYEGDPVNPFGFGEW